MPSKSLNLPLFLGQFLRDVVHSNSLEQARDLAWV